MFGSGDSELEVLIPFTSAWKMNNGFIVGIAALTLALRIGRCPR